MPTAPKIVCRCGRARFAGKPCECGVGKRKPHAKSTGERGYDWKWQKFRASYLRAHPLCEDCMSEGRVTAAAELHHKRKIKDAPHLRLDPSNVVGLCDPCHNQRSAKGE